MQTDWTRRIGIAAVLCLGSLALAGCADDEDAADDDETSSSSTTQEEASGAQDFCNAVLTVDEVISAEDPESDPMAALDAAAATAPEELSDQVQALVDDAKATMPSGGELSDESNATLAEVYGYMTENCDVNEMVVTAEDYRYVDLPESMPAGPTVVELDNQGTEMHEMAIVRINDDVTDDINAIVQLPEEEAMSKVVFKTTAFAAPGESGYTSTELEPGRYGVVCFLPEGATPEVFAQMMASDEMPEGTPHAMLGMTGEFEVT